MKPGWEVKTLGEVCEIERGGSPRPIDSYLTTDENGINWIKIGDTKGITKYIEKTEEKIRPEGAKRSRLVYEGDFILSNSMSFGRPYIMKTTGCIHDGWLVLRKPKLDQDYLYHVLGSDLVFNQFDRLAAGSTVRNLNIGLVRSVEIPVPPLAEQQRIVAFLDEAFAGIATARANAEKNLQNARALFESHLNAVFTQRGDGWVEKRLGDVCSFVGGSQPPKAVFTYNKCPDNIRLIQIRDYKSDKNIVYIPRTMARRFCSANDVMIGRYGPPLFQILRGLDGAYNVALMKAVPDEALISHDFLYHFLRNSEILRYVVYHSERAAGQIGLTKETLQPYPISLPSLEEQKVVVDAIVELESETQRLESIYQRKIAALDELKKSLLHEVFSMGK